MWSLPLNLWQTLKSFKYQLKFKGRLEFLSIPGCLQFVTFPQPLWQVQNTHGREHRRRARSKTQCAHAGDRKTLGQQQDADVQAALKMQQRDKFAAQQVTTQADQCAPRQLTTGYRGVIRQKESFAKSVYGKPILMRGLEAISITDPPASRRFSLLLPPTPPPHSPCF